MDQLENRVAGHEPWARRWALIIARSMLPVDVLCGRLRARPGGSALIADGLA
jgi:hypothetical protein